MPSKSRSKNDNGTPTAEILGAWDLFDEGRILSNLSLRDWRAIGHAIERSYSQDIQATLSSVHLGLSRSLSALEGRLPLNELAGPLVCHETLWLPDPVYSFLTEEAQEGWGLLPESGSSFFSDFKLKCAHEHNLWMAHPDQRRALIRKQMPILLETMKALRPLIESGAVRLIPWEKYVKRHCQDIKSEINRLKDHEITNRIHYAFPPEEYSLGARIWGIGIEMGDPPMPGRKKGEKLWFIDKSPPLLVGIINRIISYYSNSSFMPHLEGDRIVYDYIASGGILEPGREAISGRVQLPNLSKAIWPDVVAIRNDSEALRLFRNIISNIESSDGFLLDDIKDRINDAAARIVADKALWKAAGTTPVYVLLSFLLTATSVASTADSSKPLALAQKALIGATFAGASEFLRRLYGGIRGRKADQRRAELLLQIVDRIT